MIRRSLSFLVALGAAALLLAGCQTEDLATSKAFEPIPPKTVALMKKKGMTKEAPILVRIYKEESQLEVWKKDKSGRFAPLKTYEICRWSGTLGPKKAEGDGQAPEGFYTVTPGQLNPNSAYYLSFNLGFPNAYDRSLGRSGQHLMVHGDCLSKGCYAMTDPQIAEVYALAREALNGGQPGFQVQAMPFRMTAENMARRRDDPNMPFWKNLKEGADHFEVTKLEPKVNVCGQKYVFDADAKDGGKFDASAPCPGYEVNPSVAMAMAGKQRQDEEKFATLISKGVQTAEAYVPQNGRLRRSLDEPIKKPAPSVMIAKADSEPKASFALAMNSTGPSAPLPAPSPYVSAEPKTAKAGTAFAWLRDETPAELRTSQTPKAETSSTPAQNSGATVAAVETKRAAGSAQPIAASLVPPSSGKPFYKRLWSFGSSEEAPSPVAAPAPVTPAAAAPVPAARPVAAAVPVPAPVPVTPTPTVAAVPAPSPAPKPAAEVVPSRAASAHSAFGTAPILNASGFQ